MHPTEILCKTLFICAAVASVVTPIVAVIFYPVGIITEPITLVKKLYLIVFGFVMILIGVGSGMLGEVSVDMACCCSILGEVLLPRPLPSPGGETD